MKLNYQIKKFNFIEYNWKYSIPKYYKLKYLKNIFYLILI